MIKYFKEKKRQKQKDFFYQELNNFLDFLIEEIQVDNKSKYKVRGMTGVSGLHSWTFENMCIDKTMIALDFFFDSKSNTFCKLSENKKIHTQKVAKKKHKKVVTMERRK